VNVVRANTRSNEDNSEAVSDNNAVGTCDTDVALTSGSEKDSEVVNLMMRLMVTMLKTRRLIMMRMMMAIMMM